ncbi:hypothetical protein BH24CHL3_BH24CHL3_04690 [soil metagenome]
MPVAMSDSRSRSEVGDSAQSPRALAIAVLGDILSSKVRASILAWIAPRLDTRFSLTELSRNLGAPISSLQHECYKLERLGVLQGRREGISRRYKAQLDHALTRPLIDLTIATLGLESVLRESLTDAATVELAVIVGPDATIDRERLMLVMIGGVDLAGLDRAHRRVSLVLGIEPEHLDLAYFRSDDWLAYGESGHPLLQRIAARPIQPIIGAWPTLPDRDDA